MSRSEVSPRVASALWTPPIHDEPGVADGRQRGTPVQAGTAEWLVRWIRRTDFVLRMGRGPREACFARVYKPSRMCCNFQKEAGERWVGFRAGAVSCNHPEQLVDELNAMHMIRKGQARWVSGSDGRRQDPDTGHLPCAGLRPAVRRVLHLLDRAPTGGMRDVPGVYQSTDVRSTRPSSGAACVPCARREPSGRTRVAVE